MNNFQRLKVFHPTDFSRGSEVAFEHALKLALETEGSLEILHVASRREDIHRNDMPSVRSTLERWQVLPEGSSREAVGDLHLHVRKVVYKGRDPVKACKEHLDRHPVDLVIMAVHQSANWFHKSVGEPLARKSHEITLFLPEEVNGFVDTGTGSIQLRKVLIPVAHEPEANRGLRAMQQLVDLLDLDIELTLLYVGEEDAVPDLKSQEDIVSNARILTKKGGIAETILATADEIDADLVVMVTQGRQGFIDAFRGSVSEQVLHKIKCPLLVVPETEYYR